MQRQATLLLATALFVSSLLAANTSARGAEPAVDPFRVKLKLMGDNQMIAVRFKPATGETWMLQTGNWRRVLEVAAPPAGDYDVKLAVGINAWQAIRYDAKSGASWLLSSMQWQPIRELGGSEIKQ